MFSPWLNWETFVSEARMFWTLLKNIFLRPGSKIYVRQHMFLARLNWKTFVPAIMFPSLARPLGPIKKAMLHATICKDDF